MEKQINNFVRLCGEMVSRPVFSHRGRNDEFYTFPLVARRLSGTADRVNIILKKDLLDSEIGDGDKILVEGEIHSYNNKSGVGSKLVITVFARSISVCGGEDENEAEIYGTICKTPNFRITPMGREICDVMVAVNRPYGKSDYLPCIAWGSLAKQTSQWQVGRKVHIVGRLQSREYIKIEGQEQVTKTAYEISASFIEEAEEA